jgi:hypothetical protein
MGGNIILAFISSSTQCLSGGEDFFDVFEVLFEEVSLDDRRGRPSDASKCFKDCFLYFRRVAWIWCDSDLSMDRGESWRVGGGARRGNWERSFVFLSARNKDMRSREDVFWQGDFSSILEVSDASFWFNVSGGLSSNNGFFKGDFSGDGLLRHGSWYDDDFHTRGSVDILTEGSVKIFGIARRVCWRRWGMVVLRIIGVTDGPMVRVVGDSGSYSVH